MYEVKKKFQRGTETSAGRFNTMSQAQQFIQQELEKDALMKIAASYGLYEGADLMKWYDQADLVAGDVDSGSGSGGGGQKGSSQTFNPSPFNATPAPKGTPRSWVNDVPDKDDKK